MRIAGWQGTTLLDYPGKVAAILFLAGCNLRCPFCHNPDLVLPGRLDPSLLPDVDDILRELEKRRGFISGVVISGGEPLLCPDLDHLVQKIREMGFRVKLDTNGSLPDRLREILPRVDHVAMDIKTSPGRYPEATGGIIDFSEVQKSLDILFSSTVPFELRSTLVPGLFTPEDALDLVPLVQGAPCYALQAFSNRNTLDPAYVNVQPTPEGLIREIAGILKPWVRELSIRQVS